MGSVGMLERRRNGTPDGREQGKRDGDGGWRHNFTIESSRRKTGRGRRHEV
jgi:hypothetical protein